MRYSLRTCALHWMRIAVLGSLTFLFALTGANEIAFAQANGPQIFDLRKNLPLEPNEPVFHDFYISSGNEVGLKKGVYVSVVRAVPIHDPIQNKQQGTLNIPIGKLQIIHVEKGLSVGRLQSETSNEERPTVEFEGVMIGDRIDLGSMTTQAPPAKKKTAAVNGDSSVAVTAKVEIAVEAQKPTTEKSTQAIELASSADPNLASSPPVESQGKKEKAQPISVPVPAPKKRQDKKVEAEPAQKSSQNTPVITEVASGPDRAQYGR